MDNLAARLDRLCTPVPESGCWLWTGATTPTGYGKITASTGVTTYAHRLSWVLRHGEIPSGAYVCHKCDTPSCINPDHLFIGMAQDNSKDAVLKGRNAFGSRVKSSKLSASQAMVIFMATGTCKKLAEEFGVSASTVSLIRRGERWARTTGQSIGSSKDQTP